MASPSLSWKLCYYTCPFLRQHVTVIRYRSTRRFDFVELISGSCSSANRFFKSKELDCRRCFLVSFPVPSRRPNPQVTPATQARMKIVMINDRRNKLKVYITSVGILNVCNLWILLRKIVIYLAGRKRRLHGLFSC